jgi:hypothetical protein
MPLFGKKKEELKVKVEYDYTKWQEDLGFLTLLMTRKKNVTKNYFINIYATQLKDTDYIRDEDLEDVIYNGVSEVVNELSENYKTHLIDRYFKNEKELIKFITEDFYVELTSAAVFQNNEKIRNVAMKKKFENVTQKNRKDDLEENEE